MKTFKFIIAAVMVLALAAPGTALAQFENIRINGFASQGYIKSDGNDYLVKDSQEGSYQLNEVGVTVNAPVSDKLRIGMQLLSRDFGASGNNEFMLDWAYGDYRLQDWLGLRFGKIKLPFGLYNEERDSDFLRSMAFLPQSIYPDRRRDFLVAGNGVGLYGNVILGGAGDLDYQVVMGEINIDQDNPVITDELARFSRQILTATSGALGVDELDIESGEVTFSSLVYNTPIDGLRVGTSLASGAVEFTPRSFGLPISLFDPALPAFLDVEQEDMTTYSVEYANSYFTFATEYYTYKELFYLNFSDGTRVLDDDPQIEATYYLVSAPIPGVEGLSASYLSDTYYYRKDDKSNWRNYRKDTGLGLRYDVTSNFIVKAEWHNVEGVGALSPVDNDEDGDGNADWEKDWNYFVFKTTFVF
jgi:hypothetical protein